MNDYENQLKTSDNVHKLRYIELTQDEKFSLIYQMIDLLNEVEEEMTKD